MYCNAGILAVTGINYELEATDFIMVIGSFGATAVLVYSAWQAPLAQPRNVIGGHVLSAIVGVTFRHAMPCHAARCAGLRMSGIPPTAWPWHGIPITPLVASAAKYSIPCRKSSTWPPAWPSQRPSLSWR
jgi:hypothetical protein